MRIALVAQEYPPETAKGGIGSQTWVKARGLAALGHDIHVISRTVKGRRLDYQDGPVKVTRIPGISDRIPLYTELADWVTYSSEVAVAFADLHQREAFDLVEFPEWACEGFVCLLNRTEWSRFRAAIHLHGPLVMFAHALNWPALDSEFYRAGTAMEQACLRMADAVFSSSRCSVEWCAKHYGLDPEKIPIWHSGVDLEVFRPRENRELVQPRIVFAGKLARNKGIHLLVQAACNLAREFSGLRLRLLGRGESSIVRELEAIVREANQPELLELPGFVDRSSLPDQFATAQIFAAPSQYEGGPGFVYLEAMACGLPVIACSGSGAAEVIRPNETGLLVPPQDLGALILALRSLLADANLREEMGRRARAYVVAEADSRQCLKKLEALYASIIAGAPPFRPIA